MNQTFMKERKILPLILSMVLPMVISMAVNSLYNIVDSYFVAKISDEAMTALSLVFPIQNMINAIAIGFGVGVNASIAYFLGTEKQETADTSASFGVLLSLIHGILLTIICILIILAFLRMFTSNADILDLALNYSRRVFLFSVFVNVGICYEKLFQAVEKMKVSMFSMICGCVANIILDPLMILGIGPVPLSHYYAACSLSFKPACRSSRRLVVLPCHRASDRHPFTHYMEKIWKIRNNTRSNPDVSVHSRYHPHEYPW